MSNMKITAFSDSHGLHRSLKLPDSDILLFGGDAMTTGYKEYELIDFLEWFNEQKSVCKIMIAGNHDRYIENNRGLFLELLNSYPTIYYLENEGMTVGGLKIWGTPDSKEFCRWAFNRTEQQLEKIFSNIPEDVDILLSHAPQYGILDQLERGERVGEKTLQRKISTLKNLKYHIFGHIHCAYGEHKNEYTSLNVSVVNEQYKIQNEPISFLLNSEQEDKRSVATKPDQGTESR